MENENLTKNEDEKIRYSSRGKSIPKTKAFAEILNKNVEVDDTENPLVLLTKKNSETIEKLIEEDYSYIPFSKMIFNYLGFEKVKNDKKSLIVVVREIDRDNSTNVWRYEKNRDSFHKLISYIIDPKNNFWSGIEAGDTSIPDKIVDKCGSNIKSLSSKICKYLCEFAYKKDLYYINDSYIRALLLFYLDYYGVEHLELKSIGSVNKLSYKELYSWLDKLHQARNNKHNDEISKNELDHIMWYCYKSFKL